MPDLNNDAKSNCVNCPAGKFCGTGTITPQDCLAGFYSKDGWSACEHCLSGYYCNTNGTSFDTMLTQFCTDGKNCEEGTIDQNLSDECERGQVCVEKEPEPIPCPPGTYQPAKSMSNLRDDADGSSGKEFSLFYFKLVHLSKKNNVIL